MFSWLRREDDSAFEAEYQMLKQKLSHTEELLEDAKNQISKMQGEHHKAQVKINGLMKDDYNPDAKYSYGSNIGYLRPYKNGFALYKDRFYRADTKHFGLITPWACKVCGIPAVMFYQDFKKV